MKKLSIILAIAMMAIVSAGMISCGDKDDTSSYNANQNGFEKLNTNMSVHYSTCFMSDSTTKATTLTQLVEFFQNKVGSVATVEKNDNGGINFECTNQTNYDTMVKLLATVKNEELDAIAKKNRGIWTMSISYSNDGKTIIDYTYDYTLPIPEGTWKATEKNVDYTVKIAKGTDGTYTAEVTCGTDVPVTHKLKVNHAYYALFTSSEKKTEFSIFFYQEDTTKIKCKFELADESLQFNGLVFTKQ